LQRGVGVDFRLARVGVVSREDHCAQLLRQRPAPGDGVPDRRRAGAVEHQRGVVHHCARAQRPARRGVSHIQRARADRCASAVGIRAGQDHTVRARLGQGDRSRAVLDDAGERAALGVFIVQGQRRRSAYPRGHRTIAGQSAHRGTVAVQVQRPVDGHRPAPRSVGEHVRVAAARPQRAPRVNRRARAIGIASGKGQRARALLDQAEVSRNVIVQRHAVAAIKHQLAVAGTAVHVARSEGP